MERGDDVATGVSPLRSEPWRSGALSPFPALCRYREQCARCSELKSSGYRLVPGVALLGSRIALLDRWGVVVARSSPCRDLDLKQQQKTLENKTPWTRRRTPRRPSATARPSGERERCTTSEMYILRDVQKNTSMQRGAPTTTGFPFTFPSAEKNPNPPLKKISAPHMHLEMLDLLAPAIADKDHARVLDVGSGSGYLVACLWKMVAARGGEVVGVEKHAPLAQVSFFFSFHVSSLLRALSLSTLSNSNRFFF